MANPNWKKGMGSPNKTGRPKEARLIAELAREKCPRMIELLAEIAEDTNAPQSARVQAINAILDRDLGKAMQTINFVDEEPNYSNIPDAELVQKMFDESVKAFRAGEITADAFMLVMQMGTTTDTVN